MTNHAEYVSDPAAAFLTRTEILGGATSWTEYPRQAIRWVLEAVELDLVEPNEVYNFMKDLDEDTDMSSWIEEARSRKTLANEGTKQNAA